MDHLQWTYSYAEVLTKELARDKVVEKALSELRSTHFPSYAHSFQTAHIAITLALLNRLSLEDIAILGEGALLHDIGKSKTPREILLKPGKLGPDELEEMHNHIRYGIEMLKGYHFDKKTLVIVGNSHENQKGGYPRHNHPDDHHKRQTIGPSLHRICEMASISDHVSGLTETRPYKGSSTKREINEILEKQFLGDNILVRQAMTILGNGYLPHWERVKF